MGNSQAHVGECHAGNELAQSHALTALVLIGNSTPQALCDQADSLQVQAVRQSPCALGGVAFDSVGQCIHACGSGQALGHGGHHIRIDDGDVRDIVHVHTDELALTLHIGDNVVDSSFSSSTSGGGNGDGVNGTVLGRSNTFQRANVSELRIVDDNTDGLAGVHGGATANGDHVISTGSLVRGNTRLNILDGGIGLDVGINLIGHASRIQHVGNFLGNTELQQIRIGGDKSLLITLGGN